MGICFCLMPVNIDGGEILKEKEIQELKNVDYSFIGLAGQSEIENQWVKLHQMFDR